MGVSEGFKYRREDASGMSKAYVERFRVMFLIIKKSVHFLSKLQPQCLGVWEAKKSWSSVVNEK